MDKQDAKKRIEQLRKTIEHYRHAYHVLDKSLISDAALDSLKKELFEGIQGGIGNQRFIQHVISMSVMLNSFAQLLNSFFCILFIHIWQSPMARSALNAFQKRGKFFDYYRWTEW